MVYSQIYGITRVALLITIKERSGFALKIIWIVLTMSRMFANLSQLMQYSQMKADMLLVY